MFLVVLGLGKGRGGLIRNSMWTAKDCICNLVLVKIPHLVHWLYSCALNFLLLTFWCTFSCFAQLCYLFACMLLCELCVCTFYLVPCDVLQVFFDYFTFVRLLQTRQFSCLCRDGVFMSTWLASWCKLTWWPSKCSATLFNICMIVIWLTRPWSLA